MLVRRIAPLVIVTLSIFLGFRAEIAHGQKAEDHNNKGISLLKQGKTNEAIAEFKQAIQMKPDLAPAHFNLGKAYKKKGALDDAIASYKEAIKYNPKGEYYQDLGLAYKDKKMFSEAIDAYKKAAVADPKNAETFFKLGNAYLDKESFADAITHYNKALSLRHPKPAGIYFNLGVTYQKKGDNLEAAKAYEAYLKASPRASNAKQIQEIIKGLREQAKDQQVKK
ncbi:MAG: tetratricopeptide repeat protein [Candidatus Latescibacteria bacterium]|nr:tetratricopeptide repeat protein [Candidatus Latescibacterota bacterium]